MSKKVAVKKAGPAKQISPVKIKGPVPPGGISDVTFYRRQVDGWSPGDPADVEIEFDQLDGDDRLVRGARLNLLLRQRPDQHYGSCDLADKC